MARQIGDRRSEGIWLGNLGRMHATLSESDPALERYQAALQIATAVGDRRHEALWMTNIGNVHLEDGRWGLALASQEQAHEISEEIGEKRIALYASIARASCHRLTGEIELARQHLVRADKLLEGYPLEDARALMLCERGHLELHANRSALQILGEVQSIAAEMTVGSGTWLARALDRITRAVAAHAKAEQLCYGQCLEDVPHDAQRKVAQERE